MAYREWERKKVNKQEKCKNKSDIGREREKEKKNDRKSMYIVHLRDYMTSY